MPSFATVFGKQGAAPLDLPLLNALFSGHGQKTQERPASVRGKDGVSVLDFRRAMGVEIALSKVSISLEELQSCLQNLDFGRSGLRAEDVERLLGKMPTAEESQLLLKHAGAPEKLRHLERQLLPLCGLPSVERRLRILHYGLSHAQQHAQLLGRLETVHLAASQVLASARLHAVLRHALQIANYINHGSHEGAKTFSVASFSAFASFRLGSSSALHYLCLTLCGAEFVRLLREDLSQVFRAARDSTEAQQEELRAFRTCVGEAEAQLEAELDPAAQVRLAGLVRSLVAEQASLQRAEERARARSEEAQRFLGERGAEPLRSEAFFAHVAGLVGHLEVALEEVARNPRRWQDLLAAGAPQAEAEAERATPQAAAAEAKPQADTATAKAAEDTGCAMEHESSPTDAPRRKKRVSLIADGLSVQRVVGALNSGAPFPVE